MIGAIKRRIAIDFIRDSRCVEENEFWCIWMVELPVLLLSTFIFVPSGPFGNNLTLKRYLKCNIILQSSQEKVSSYNLGKLLNCWQYSIILVRNCFPLRKTLRNNSKLVSIYKQHNLNSSMTLFTPSRHLKKTADNCKFPFQWKTQV